MANPVGRPPKFKTPEDMEKALNDYFADCVENGKPLTVTGMVIACDFTSRQSFFDYIERKPEFADTIKKAKVKVENYLEERLALGQGNAAGLIFNLKNNFKWVDKHEIKQEIEGSLSLTEILTGKNKDS